MSRAFERRNVVLVTTRATLIKRRPTTQPAPFFTSCSVNNLTQSAVCVRCLSRLTKLRSGLSRGLLSSNPTPRSLSLSLPRAAGSFSSTRPSSHRQLTASRFLLGGTAKSMVASATRQTCFGLDRMVRRVNGPRHTKRPSRPIS